MDSSRQVAGKGANWTALYAGDSALILEFGNRIDSAIVDQINALDLRIRTAMIDGTVEGIRETVPTFRSLAIIYDSARIHPTALIDRVSELESTIDQGDAAPESGNHWRLPVLYGTEHGPDLDDVATLTGLSSDAVVDLHSTCTFTAYMLGFLPGYAFLGDTPEELHLPRRAEPRLRVPAGSVAIAMQLTGVYPWESPGGWHILGNCPVPMFNAALSPPALLRAGDQISFFPIDELQYHDLKAELSDSSADRNRWAFDSR